jgi:hypothetical protein
LEENKGQLVSPRFIYAKVYRNEPNGKDNREEEKVGKVIEGRLTKFEKFFKYDFLIFHHELK